MSRLLLTGSLAVLMSLSALAAEDKPPAFAPSFPPHLPGPAPPPIQALSPGPIMLPPPSTYPPGAMLAPSPHANHQRKIYRVKHLPAIDLAEAIQVIKAVPTPPVVVVPEVITNSLVIYGSESAVESAIELAEQLDRRPKMVQVRVLIAEIHAGDDDAKSIGALLTRLSNADGDQDFDQVAAAIAELPGVRLLGGPQLTLLDNQPGFLQVGQRVPRITGTQVSSRGRMNTVEMENVGLVLAVTARINDDGLVTMEVDLEKSQLGPADEGTPITVPAEGEPIRAAQIDTLTCQTTIAVRDGRIMVLGGLASRQGEMVILISPRIVEP